MGSPHLPSGGGREEAFFTLHPTFIYYFKWTLVFFFKKIHKNLRISKKSSTFAPAFAQVAELVDALVSNTNGKPCRFDPGPGY